MGTTVRVHAQVQLLECVTPVANNAHNTVITNALMGVMMDASQLVAMRVEAIAILSVPTLPNLLASHVMEPVQEVVAPLVL